MIKWLIFFRVWTDPNGRDFFTLHLSAEAATKFRREANARRKAGTWKSSPQNKVRNREVPKKVYDAIAERLDGRSGVKGSIGDFE